MRRPIPINIFLDKTNNLLSRKIVFHDLKNENYFLNFKEPSNISNISFDENWSKIPPLYLLFGESKTAFLLFDK